MTSDDPREIIIAFLRGLPQTIRTEALLFVIVYGIRTNPSDATEDFEKTVDDFLATGGMPGIGAVICTIAALDYELESLTFKLPDAEVGLATITNQYPENAAFQQSYLSFPMRQKHWEQALAEWRRLRRTKLTAQKLWDFGDSQLKKPTLRSK